MATSASDSSTSDEEQSETSTSDNSSSADEQSDSSSSTISISSSDDKESETSPPSKFPSDKLRRTYLLNGHNIDPLTQFGQARLEGCLVENKYSLTKITPNKGAYSEIYKGFLKGDPGKMVVVKRLNWLSLSAQTYEISTQWSLRHENIIQVREVFLNKEGTLDLVMEYARYNTLSDLMLLDNPKRTPEANVFPFDMDVFVGEIMFQVCTAMEYIHRKGFMHRDVKPANILVSQKLPLKLKVADFGFATNSPIEIGNWGTEMFMAPELAECELYDREVDSYSVGVMFLQLLMKTNTNVPPAYRDRVVDLRIGPVDSDHVREYAGLRMRFLWRVLDDKCWKIHDDAIVLAQGLLEFELTHCQRTTMREALKTKWVKEMHERYSQECRQQLDVKSGETEKLKDKNVQRQILHEHPTHKIRPRQYRKAPYARGP